MTNETTVQTAEFNPQIKPYLLVYVTLVLALTLIGIPFIIFWVTGLGQLFCRKYYENLHCQLTERHLVFQKGVMFKVEKTIPLENIQDLTFIQNPLLNAMNLRILKIETAGHSNPQGSDMKLIGINDLAGFKQKVLEQRELIRNEIKNLPLQTASDQDEVVSLLKEIRDILGEIRNI
jgi:putative membrane protein